MEKGINVIENGNVNLTTNNNSNVNDVKAKRYEKGRHVEVIADELMKRFNAAHGSRPFFCKVGWTLSEARIWYNVEQALDPNKKVTNPIGLFIYLCKRDGV